MRAYSVDDLGFRVEGLGLRLWALGLAGLGMSWVRVQDFGWVEPLESNGKKFITVIGVYIRTYIHIYI